MNLCTNSCKQCNFFIMYERQLNFSLSALLGLVIVIFIPSFIVAHVVFCEKCGNSFKKPHSLKKQQAQLDNYSNVMPGMKRHGETSDPNYAMQSQMLKRHDGQHYKIGQVYDFEKRDSRFSTDSKFEPTQFFDSPGLGPQQFLSSENESVVHDKNKKNSESDKHQKKWDHIGQNQINNIRKINLSKSQHRLAGSEARFAKFRTPMTTKFWYSRAKNSNKLRYQYLKRTVSGSARKNTSESKIDYRTMNQKKSLSRQSPWAFWFCMVKDDC